MHRIDLEYKYQNESSLQSPCSLNSLDTGEKDHSENLPGSYRKPPFLLLVVVSSIAELDKMYFRREIFL